MLKPHFGLMVAYNALMNKKICEHIHAMPKDTLWDDKKAFFGSVLGTMNRIMVGDLIWLTRFNQHPNYPSGFKALARLIDLPAPTALNQTLYNDK